jgi:hypothetical protein
LGAAGEAICAYLRHDVKERRFESFGVFLSGLPWKEAWWYTISKFENRRSSICLEDLPCSSLLRLKKRFENGRSTGLPF